MSQNATECDSLDDLSPDELLAVAVATCPTISEAAKLAGVSRSTIYRAFQTPFFSMAVADVRNAVKEARINRAAQVADEATSALLDVLRDGEASTDQKIRAASSLLGKFG